MSTTPKTAKATPTNAVWWSTILGPIAGIVVVFLPQVHATSYVQAASVIAAGIWTLVIPLATGGKNYLERFVTAIEHDSGLIEAIKSIATASRGLALETNPQVVQNAIDQRRALVDLLTKEISTLQEIHPPTTP